GLIQSGEMYNQFPTKCVLEGTRRWLPGTTSDEAEHEFREIITEACRATGATADVEFRQVRDAFALDTEHAVVTDFQASLHDLTGATLKFGVKPFVDDGNSFWGLRKTPAITHGPRAGGQHTVHEWVEIDDLTRVAIVYAMTAIRFCGRAADAHPT